MGDEVVVPLPGLEGALNPLDEAQLRSAEARRVVEGSRYMEAWMDDYFTLLGEGWSWRQAIYILWASQPQPRAPRTQAELATLLGLTSDRAIRDWREQNPAIEVRVAQMAASALLKARADVIAALAESASNPNYKHHNDRKLFLEMTGDYAPQQRLTIAAPVTTQEVEEADTETLRAMAALPAGKP